MTTLTLRDAGFLGGSSGAALWTPAQITTALWLDAADASTITAVSGAVSQWNDKSGNNRHATQSTAGSRPLYNTSLLNGMAGIAFDGSNDWMESGSITLLPASTTNYIMAAVARIGSAKEFGSVFMHTTSTRNFGLQRTGNNLNVYAANDNLIYYQYERNFLSGIDTVVYQGATSPRIVYRYNGSNVAFIAAPGAAPVSLTSASGTYQLGRTVSTYELSCDIHELIIFPGSSASADFQRLEGYLAQKWGLQANLPANHPYKSAAPTL